MKVILSIVIALFVIGCSENTQKEEQVVETKKVEVVEEKSTLDKAGDKASEAKEELTQKVTEATDTVVDTVSEVTEEVSAKVSESTQTVSKKASEVVDTVSDKVAKVTKPKIDADLLYNKCAGCHGGMGERAALGKSAVIRDWSPKQIEHALKGYRDGTYGRTMKAMMTQQVRDMSDAELKALSLYIAEK